MQHRQTIADDAASIADESAHWVTEDGLEIALRPRSATGLAAGRQGIVTAVALSELAAERRQAAADARRAEIGQALAAAFGASLSVLRPLRALLASLAYSIRPAAGVNRAGDGLPDGGRAR
jgi:hypothetical protein